MFVFVNIFQDGAKCWRRCGFLPSLVFIVSSRLPPLYKIFLIIDNDMHCSSCARITSARCGPWAMYFFFCCCSRTKQLWSTTRGNRPGPFPPASAKPPFLHCCRALLMVFIIYTPASLLQTVLLLSTFLFSTRRSRLQQLSTWTYNRLQQDTIHGLFLCYFNNSNVPHTLFADCKTRTYLLFCLNAMHLHATSKKDLFFQYIQRH